MKLKRYLYGLVASHGTDPASVLDIIRQDQIDKCNEGSSFFALPSWHKYLFKRPDYVDGNFTGTCTPVIGDINDIWHIGLAVLELLVRASSLLAVGLIVYSGVIYTMSRGKPELVEKAKKTLLYSVIGLAVSVMAIFIVTFGASLVS